jgi:hypothetical protein
MEGVDMGLDTLLQSLALILYREVETDDDVFYWKRSCVSKAGWLRRAANKVPVWKYLKRFALVFP